jgi:hypothetical protein
VILAADTELMGCWRDSVARRLADAARLQASAAHRQGYLDHPETADELSRAEQTDSRLTEEEPWEPWW